MIVVTGATGKLGSRIAQELLQLTGPGSFAVSVRDPAKAASLGARGIEVRRGDYGDPASLTEAFRGATKVLLVSSNARASGGDPIAQHRHAIDAAQAAGARRIVYTSHMAASATSAFSPMHDHAATERLLAESGMTWTALRNGFYAATVPTLIGSAAETGTIEAPEDGPVGWTTHGDLAAAAARILLDDGRFEGPTPPLTGSEAPDLTRVAELLSDQTGRVVKRRIITDHEQARRLGERGLPSLVAEMTLGIYRAARAGEFAAVDPMLASLIGRAPVPLREVLAGRDPG